MTTTYVEITPARARAKKPDKLWLDAEWYGEEKLNGWRFLIHFGRELQRCYITGRRISKTTGLLSEKGMCARPLWPEHNGLKYTVLDGEVMAPTHFRDIAGIMNVSPSRAEKRIKEIGPPRFVAFDIVYYDGDCVKGHYYLERKNMLREALERINHPLITAVPYWSGNLRAGYEAIVERGGEGVVLKHYLGEYGDDWVKVKKSYTLDVIVTRFTDAKLGKTGKYLGLIGAAVVSVYSSDGQLLEVGRVSGMTDEVRVDMTQHPERWIGQVIEIEAKGWAKERLWHPQYKRPRPDASPRDATFAKMMAELNATTAATRGEQLDLFQSRGS